MEVDQNQEGIKSHPLREFSSERGLHLLVTISVSKAPEL